MVQLKWTQGLFSSVPLKLSGRSGEQNPRLEATCLALAAPSYHISQVINPLQCGLSRTVEALAATWAAVCQAHDCLTKDLLMNGNPACEVAISVQFPASWSQGLRLWCLGANQASCFRPANTSQSLPILYKTNHDFHCHKTCQNVSVDGSQKSTRTDSGAGTGSARQSKDQEPRIAMLPLPRSQLHGMSQC